jgi:hypothetical protein
MKLSDVMSGATGLSSYAEVALLVFFFVFLVVIIDLARAGRRYEGARHLPLSDDAERRSDANENGGRQ